jgi:aspartyl-tRNA(Asn)/glutamyl-tRNA(Gln) amidotransferase subunit B
MGELSRRLNAQDIGIELAPVNAETLGALITRISDGTISNNAARQVFEVLWEDAAATVDGVIESKGLRQMNDTGALEKIVDDVIAANAKNVSEFKGGNEKALNALVGQIMKASKGKANPQQVNDLLRAKLA